MSREEKIKFLIDSIWNIEEATVGPGYFESYTDGELDKEIKWYEYLLEKMIFKRLNNHQNKEAHHDLRCLCMRLS